MLEISSFRCIVERDILSKTTQLVILHLESNEKRIPKSRQTAAYVHTRVETSRTTSHALRTLRTQKASSKNYTDGEAEEKFSSGVNVAERSLSSPRLMLLASRETVSPLADEGVVGLEPPGFAGVRRDGFDIEPGVFRLRRSNFPSAVLLLHRLESMLLRSSSSRVGVVLRDEEWELDLSLVLSLRMLGRLFLSLGTSSLDEELEYEC